MAAKKDKTVDELVDELTAQDVRPLRRWRLAAGLTQRQLSEAAGLDQAYVSRSETSAERNFHIDTIRKWSAALGVPPVKIAEFRRTARMDPPGVIEALIERQRALEDEDRTARLREELLRASAPPDDTAAGGGAPDRPSPS